MKLILAIALFLQHREKDLQQRVLLKTLDYGIQDLHLQCIVGRAHIENTASLKVLRKIGMKYLCNEIVDNCPVETYGDFNPKS